MKPSSTPRGGSLTIFFPMWNEEDYIRATLDAGREVCERLLAEQEIGDYELLVVDDASTDNTGLIADGIAAIDPRVRVVHHPVNRRLGGCIKTGFADARGDLVLYTDADLPFDMGELAKACRLLRYYDADIVTAYRHDRTGEGSQRAVYSYVYNWIVRLVFGLRIRDVNFAFKLCRRTVLDKIELASEGSFIDAELPRPGAAPGLQDDPVRRRLLPPQPGRVDAVVALGDPRHHPGDARSPFGAGPGHRPRLPPPARNRRARHRSAGVPDA